MESFISPLTVTAIPLASRPQSVTAAEQAGETPLLCVKHGIIPRWKTPCRAQRIAHSGIADEVQSLHDAVEALRTISKEIRAAVSVLDTNTAGK